MPSHIYVNEHIANLSLSSIPQDTRIRDFHKTLPHYAPTPLVSLPAVAKELGVAHVLLKDESTRLGLAAFKILGASWAIYRTLVQRLNLTQSNGIESIIPLDVLASAAQAEDLVLYAATDGNHGRAVARMARYLGINAMILVPQFLDKEAKSKIAAEGADVEVYEGDYDGTVLKTKQTAKAHEAGKGILISDTSLEGDKDEIPEWIVDGYQTMFDEIEEQVKKIVSQKGVVSHVVTPVGVGSLAQSVVKHFRRCPKKVSIVAVEPIAAACLQSSLKAGEMRSVATGYTICSGMCCGTLSANGWPVLKAGVAFSVAVEDDEVVDALGELEKFDVKAGPCGAAALAGLKQLAAYGAGDLMPDSVVILLCTEGKRGYEVK